MSRSKVDLSYLTLNQLCTLTGKTYRTLKKLLADIDPGEDSDGNSFLYSPQEVLPVIYGIRSARGDEQVPGLPPGFLDPVQEKAKLDKVRREKVELELGVMRGELVPKEHVEEQWLALAGAFRTRILGMPSKLALRLMNKADPKAIQRIIENECHDALKELSQHEPGAGSDPDRSQSH